MSWNRSPSPVSRSAFCLQLGAHQRPDDLGRGLGHRVLPRSESASAWRTARAGASRSDSGASCEIRTSTLFSLGVAVGLDHGARRDLPDGIADPVGVRRFLELQHELSPARELDAVAQVARPDPEDTRGDQQRGKGDEVLRLAQEVDVRVLDDLHDAALDAQAVDVALAEHPLEEELADEVGRRTRSPPARSPASRRSP